MDACVHCECSDSYFCTLSCGSVEEQHARTAAWLSAYIYLYLGQSRR